MLAGAGGQGEIKSAAAAAVGNSRTATKDTLKSQLIILG
jgi:hypothetical protein